MERTKRILTGDRTTGRLHLGHYVGSLQNRVKLQHMHDTFILLADVQALTTHFENPALIRESVRQVAIDNLAAGLDPSLVTLVRQSQTPAIAELTVFYSMLVLVNVLRHNPTIKTEARQYGFEDLSYGFLGYPVSQTADITFCRADLVPVGGDQLPHLELSRKIVRRFLDLYGQKGLSLPVPKPLLSQTPRLAGLDGKSKMGKSLGNAVFLSDDRRTVAEKVRSAVTDTNRVKLTDRGDPARCVVASYHKVFCASEYENICEMCQDAAIGCVSCKKRLAEGINALLDPMREKRTFYESRQGLVDEYITAGTEKANAVGQGVVGQVKEAMGLTL